MKNLLLFGLLLLAGTFLAAQNCSVISKRNNGNGQPNNCPGVSGTPMAANFTGTPYATQMNGLPKTGDITFAFPGVVTAPPAIRNIWIGTTLSAAVAGPAAVPVVSGSTTSVKYCFYNVNLPPAGAFTLEFVNPQTNELLSFCSYSGSSNATINPPQILTQPQSQTACQGNNATFTITAQAGNGGNLTYQWRKNGVNIAGATSSSLQLNNVMATDAAGYDCLVAETNGAFITSNVATLTVSTCNSNQFMDKCAQLPSATNISGWNCAWTDYNNDGWEDIFFTDKSGATPGMLYRNNGNGTFTNITGAGFSANLAPATGSAWSDINNDGLPDVLIVNDTQLPAMLYQNSGGGNFTPIPNSGIDPNPQYFHGAAWADFDNDGFIDLLLTNYFETRFHQLYRNNGNSTFTRIENSPVCMESNRSGAPVLADFNNDGLVDIFIPNGNNTPNSLFRNTGGMNFENVTAGDLAADAANSVGAAWGDYDNDGWADLFVANASDQQNALYKNTGGAFVKVTNSVVSQDYGHSHGANFTDIDNDADLDLFVTNDQGPNFLYLNDGTGNFTKITDEEIATDIGYNFGQAWADCNRDGFIDLALAFHAGQKDRLYCNKGNGNKWLNIQLRGLVSNFSALGTTIKVKAAGKWQMRQVLPVSGFGSQNSLRQHFGLGSASVADSVEIYWPSGYVQRIANLSANQFITITEEEANLVQGVVFNDTNNNCILNPGEQTVSTVTLRIMPDNKLLATNQNGQYHVRLKNGTYTLETTYNPMWQSNCAVSFTLSGFNQNQVANVPVYAASGNYDLEVATATTAWRRGFKGESIVSYKNLGASTAYNVQITLTYPPEVMLTDASKPFETPQPNTYSWNIDSVKAGHSAFITLIDSVLLSSYVGQNLQVSTQIAASGSDFSPSNNTYSELREVVGAIDPNDILVSPMGTGTGGFIDKEQELTYTIRFQNVGTYPAYRVIIENTLPEQADPATFKVLSSSHDFEYSLTENSLLRVVFDAINLPDSTNNEPESHGFFIYAVSPAKTVSGGTQIKNNASIVFDYEDPVITNTTLNTIKYHTAPKTYELYIYPNPAACTTLLTIDPHYFMYKNYATIKDIAIYDASGAMVKQLFPYNGNNFMLDVTTLNGTFFIIKATDQNNNTYIGKLLKY